MAARSIIPFEVVSYVESGGVRVQVSGELDIATVPLLAEALGAVEREHDGNIELDLAALTFTDASGLHAILSASQRARRNGRRLIVTRPAPAINRLLELTGIDRSLELTGVPGSVAASPPADA